MFNQRRSLVVTSNSLWRLLWIHPIKQHAINLCFVSQHRHTWLHIVVELRPHMLVSFSVTAGQLAYNQLSFCFCPSFCICLFSYHPLPTRTTQPPSSPSVLFLLMVLHLCGPLGGLTASWARWWKWPLWQSNTIPICPTLARLASNSIADAHQETC